MQTNHSLKRDLIFAQTSKTDIAAQRKKWQI